MRCGMSESTGMTTAYVVVMPNGEILTPEDPIPEAMLSEWIETQNRGGHALEVGGVPVMIQRTQ